LSYMEMKERWQGIPWWERISNPNKPEKILWGAAIRHGIEYDRHKEQVPPIGWKEFVDIGLAPTTVSRGIEAMYLAMNDSRFNDYDFYFIGYFGLDQAFKGNPYEQKLQLNEYLLLTDWIKKGLIKYLPEYINSENGNYNRNLIRNKIFIHEH